MADLSQIAMLGLDRVELAALVDGVGEPVYRARQLLDAVYRQRVESIEEISTLPQQLRTKLAEKGVSVGLPRIERKFVSQDGTVRYLIGFPDG
ncbi:MAG: 23S rRNA (adenine(2503)-C(2))-methyltransferase RlmN, partial [Candidatus Sulfotelmatobacter sp.]